MTFIVPPGRNATLAKAWADHKAAQKVAARAEKKAKPEPTPAPTKKPKPPRSKGGTTKAKK